MSDTPRTDATRFEVFDGSNWITVCALDHCEKLEIENAALKTALIDALGPVIGYAVTYRFDHSLPANHPTHAELIDRIKRLTQ